MKKNLLIIFVFLASIIEAKVAYLVPFAGHDPRMLFFDPLAYRDEVSRPYCALREALEKKGYTVEFTDTAAGLKSFDLLISLTNINPTLLKNLAGHPKEKCWLLVFEPPVVMPEIYHPSLTKTFGKIFVMMDHLVNDRNYCKFVFPQPRMQRVEQIPDFLDKKLCVLIAGNKDSKHPSSLYKERRNVINFFNQYAPEELDLYGNGWWGYPNWKGKIDQKWEVLKKYKFNIAYENMGDQRGYITEKIFDSLIGGCVPIYLGASNITDYVPRGCFIDRRDFSSDLQLYEYIKNMDRKTYEKHLDAIEDYLKTPQAQLFSIENFVHSILKHLP